MKNIAKFTASKTDKGYEVFVYWEKRYTFSSLRAANKFLVAANSLLFTELFKINELLIDIFPDAQRLLFTASLRDQSNISKSLMEIQEMLGYCHFSSGQNKTVHVISKIEQCYSQLKELNDIIFRESKRLNNTIAVYKCKIFGERLEMSQNDFMEFKFVRLEKLVKNIECKVIKLAV